jgi:hypothetical protein
MKYNALESKYKLVSLKKALASQELDRANKGTTAQSKGYQPLRSLGSAP